jgi:glycosyltransferase involved in cell wall biosynthesis
MRRNLPLRVLTYGDIGGSGGYVQYCKGLFASRAVPEDMEICFVCSPQFLDQIKPVDADVKVVSHPWPASHSRLQRYLWHSLLYPRLVHRFAPDIEFYPSGQLRVYLRRATTVATCHNLLLFDMEELRRLEGTPDYRFFMNYRKRLRRSLQRASGVIFLSEHSRQVVLEDSPGIEQYRVVAHGLDPAFLMSEKRPYTLGESVNLLYVSPIYPYKHHPEVLRAVRTIREATGLEICLRVVGSAAPDARQHLEGIIRSEGAEGYVDIAGEVSRNDLLEEYRQADLFVFASSSETFGITLLEAMGARLPIACSSHTGLPDILKDAGVYFDPDDPGSIACAITQLISSTENRQMLGERAHQYAHAYTWKRCAGQTFDFIRQVYEVSVGESSRAQ